MNKIVLIITGYIFFIGSIFLMINAGIIAYKSFVISNNGIVVLGRTSQVEKIVDTEGTIVTSTITYRYKGEEYMVRNKYGSSDTTYRLNDMVKIGFFKTNPREAVIFNNKEMYDYPREVFLLGFLIFLVSLFINYLKIE